MGEQAKEKTSYGESVRVSAEVHRQLLTIQYQRKMAGQYMSFSDIIAEQLAKADAE